MKSVIVVANRTATSDELLHALKERTAREPTSVLLVVPGTPHNDDHVPAEQVLDEAVRHMRDAGLEASGVVGAADPVAAVKAVWDPRRFDEIIVSTLPLSSSKWIPAGLPERIRRLTDAKVTHVVSQPAASPLLT